MTVRWWMLPLAIPFLALVGGSFVAVFGYLAIFAFSHVAEWLTRTLGDPIAGGTAHRAAAYVILVRAIAQAKKP